MTREQATDDDERTPRRKSVRGLLALIARNTTPPPRKQPDPEGRSEVRGD